MRPATGSVAAALKLTESGSSAIRDTGAATRCAHHPAIHTGHHTGSRARPSAAGGGLEHDARDVLTGTPAIPLRQQEELTTVDPERFDLHHRLVLGRPGILHFAQLDRFGSARS